MQREPSRISSGRRLKTKKKSDKFKPLDKKTMALIVNDLMTKGKSDTKPKNKKEKKGKTI